MRQNRGRNDSSLLVASGEPARGVRVLDRTRAGASGDGGLPPT